MFRSRISLFSNSITLHDGIDYTSPRTYSFTTMNTLLLLVALAAPFLLLGAAVTALIVIIGRRTSR